jgi:hypothetical protein
MLVARGARQGVKRALRGSVEGGPWRSGRRSEARHEQRLVDAALEDRDAQLHALRDDVPSLESGLAGELSGRQVNGHRSCVPPACLHRSERIARVSDNLNLICLKGCPIRTNGQTTRRNSGCANPQSVAGGRVAGHGLRLRRLRLRGVSRATRPNRRLCSAGRRRGSRSASVYCLRGRSSCAGFVRERSPPVYRATVVCLRVGEPTVRQCLLASATRGSVRYVLPAGGEREVGAHLARG